MPTSWLFRRCVELFCLVLVCGLGFSQQVWAAAAWDLTLTRLTTTPVASGTEVVYELQLQCSAVAEPSCDNGSVSLDIPDDLLSILDLSVNLPNPLIQSVTPTATGATINLIGAFPAGATGSILFTVTPPNGITPDGYSWIVEAELSGDNTGEVPEITTADGSSTATPHLDIVKWGPGGPLDGQVLLLDLSVTYNLVPCVDAAVTTGDLWLESMTLVDTLPAEAVYESSTGGDYDATSHTVSWTIPGPVEPSSCDALNSAYQVTVTYPGTINPLPYFSTNTVEMTGTPIGTSTPLTVDDTFTHSVDNASPNGTFAKTVTVETNDTYGDYSVPARKRV